MAALKYVEFDGIERINNSLLHRELGFVTLNGQVEMYEIPKSRSGIYHVLGTGNRSRSNSLEKKKSGSRNNSMSEGSSNKKQTKTKEKEVPITPSYEQFAEAAATTTTTVDFSKPEERRARSQSITSNNGAVSSSRSGNYPQLADPSTLDPSGQGGPAGDGRIATIGGGNGDDPNRIVSAVGRAAPRPRTCSLSEAPDMDTEEQKSLLLGLINTLNESHPDYDFSRSAPEQFIYNAEISAVIRDVNTHFADIVKDEPGFLDQLWKEINEAVALKDCQVFSYEPDLEGDPFSEHTVWCFNYFFFNEERRMICYFTSTARIKGTHSNSDNTNTSQGDDFSTQSPSPGNSPYPITPNSTYNNNSEGEIESDVDGVDGVYNMDTNELDQDEF